MQTLLDILMKAGGWHHGLYFRIECPPYPALIVDATDESGPCGLPALSVAQYPDALAAPEMCLELSFAGGPNLNPFYWRHDRVGSEHWSRFIDHDRYVFVPRLHQWQQRYAALWDRRLRVQGFVEAFSPAHHVRS